MSTAKKTETAATPAPASVPAWKQKMKGAHSASEFTASWVGMSPMEMDSTIEEGKAEKFEQEAILDLPITIFGYSKRDGDKRPYAIVSMIIDNHEVPAIFLTSGEVILKKLKTIGEADGFPVKCKIVKPEGKRYFDLINQD